MINQPETPVKLPADVKKAVEKTKQQIVVNKEEVKTLKRAKLAEEKIISEALKKKEEVLNEISILEKKLKSHSDKNKKLEELNSKLVAENKRLNKLNEETIVSIRLSRIKLTKNLKELVTKQDKIAKEEVEIKLEKENIRIKEAKIVAFNNKISKVVAEYK